MSLTESAVTSVSIPSLMGLATIVPFAIAYVRLAVRLVVGTGGSILIDRKGLLLVTGPYLYRHLSREQLPDPTFPTHGRDGRLYCLQFECHVIRGFYRYEYFR